MAISHITKLYAVEDAKIAKLTADTAGGSTTYAAVVDLPGIKSVSISPEISSVELRGDNTQIESDSTLVSVTLGFEQAKVSLDALDILVGGTVTDSGTGSTEVVTYDRLSTDAFEYFKFEAKTPTNGVDTPGGDAHLIAWKCKVTSWSFGLAEEDYQTVSFEARAVSTLAASKLFSIVLNETAAAIA